MTCAPLCHGARIVACPCPFLRCTGGLAVRTHGCDVRQLMALFSAAAHRWAHSPGGSVRRGTIALRRGRASRHWTSAWARLSPGNAKQMSGVAGAGRCCRGLVQGRPVQSSLLEQYLVDPLAGCSNWPQEARRLKRWRNGPVGQLITIWPTRRWRCDATVMVGCRCTRP